MMLSFLISGFGLLLGAETAFAQSSITEIPINTEKTVTTALGVTGLHASFGSPDQYMAVLRIAPFAAGRRYEATLTFDAGTDIGYGYSLVDGNPFGKDWASMIGIGTGTGTREMKGKQEKCLFTVDPKSTANAIYFVIRTNKPFTFRYGVSDTLSGATPNSQDKWGYYYVSDFDANRTSPFIITR